MKQQADFNDKEFLAFAKTYLSEAFPIQIELIALTIPTWHTWPNIPWMPTRLSASIWVAALRTSREYMQILAELKRPGA